LGYNAKLLTTDYANNNKRLEELYRIILEGTKFHGIIATDPDVTVTKLYADDKEMAEAMTINDETKIDLKFGNDPMVDKQYREDLFGNNDAKLEIETDDDMLEALARFYSNYQTGNETRDEVAARMSSWLLELQELRAMKKNLKNFMDDFRRYKNSTSEAYNKKYTEYVNGKVAAINVIVSYIRHYGLDLDNEVWK
jgi:hypothetical protein